MSGVKNWYLEEKNKRTLASLEKNGFKTLYMATKREAADEVLKLIPKGVLVGVGGSMTVRELGLVEALIRRGNEVAQHWQAGLSEKGRMVARRRQLTSDVFLTSSNAITERGQLVNIDGAGNRVAAMIFGPKKVIVVAGANKIVKDLNEALERVRKVAAPMDARRLNLKTPCAVSGVCTDCDAPDRICRVTTIMHRKPLKTDITVVLVGEELGY
jgi:L-lactate utilization protein LutB